MAVALSSVVGPGEAAAEAPERRPDSRDDHDLTRVQPSRAVSDTRPLAHSVVRVLMVDNYDSFTYNLVHLLEELGPGRRSSDDEVAPDEAPHSSRPPRRFPRPGQAAAAAARSSSSVRSGRRSRLGVCLGHQAIVEAFGAAGPARALLHGRRAGAPRRPGVFEGCPRRLEAGRYHCRDDARAEALEVTAPPRTGR
jgi:anthranilate/para-aminobenzoate synthase component II